MELGTIYRRSPRIVGRSIAGEYVLVPISHKAGDVQSIYTLDEVATFIWEKIDGRTSVAELWEAVADDFDVTAEQARQDLMVFLAQLEQIEAIEAV